MNVIELQGCSPTPLAHYLKAVGILRLVTEQADSGARGYWRNERFHLVTSLTREALERFFLDEYSPTPFMSPWNGASGFYRTWDVKKKCFRNSKNGRALSSLISKTSRRFKKWRATYDAIVQSIDEIAQPLNVLNADKKTLENSLILPGDTRNDDRAISKDQAKLALQIACKRLLAGNHFVRAAFIVDGKGEPKYPILFGSGGNDGAIDFTARFMENVLELIDGEGNAKLHSKDLLCSSLHSTPANGLFTGAKGKVGQFFPGSAGGANVSVGFGGQNLCILNAWDFVLLLEGSVAFTPSLCSRSSIQERPLAAAPFSFFTSSSGYATGVDDEESRGEQWMPLWDRPLTYRELSSVLLEARCSVGKMPAKRPVEMARAIARFGVVRGISEFERYGFHKRNGDARFATPLGRWTVPSSPPPYQELLDQIEGWVDRLRIKAGGKGAPASIGRAARRCENAMMDCCRPGADAADWRELLVRLGDAESALVRSPGFTGSAGLQPLGAFGRLSAQWLTAAGEQSAELRLALALAGAHGTKRMAGKKQSEPIIVWNPADPVRQHFLPLDTGSDRWAPTKFDVAGERLATGPSVVCVSGDLQRDAVRLLRRRLTIAMQDGDEFFPLTSVPGTEASLTDILALLSGQVNEADVLALARPLMALDWRQVDKERMSVRETLGTPTLREDRRAADSLGIYGLFRLCHHWRSIETPVDTSSENPDEWLYAEHVVRHAPAILTHLAQGNLATATKLAVHRLKVSGLLPHVRRAVGDRRFAGRLAMSLVFPISQANVRSLSHRLVRPEIKSEPEETVV